LKFLFQNPASVLSLADLHEKLARPERLTLDPADASSTADANTVLGSLTNALDRLTNNRRGTYLDWKGGARA
jgi:fructose-1,6-bisphosphatase